jgi:CheY-like chemotaxis protein
MNLLVRSDNKKNQKEIDAALHELACNLYFVRDDIKMFSLLEQRYMNAVIIQIDDEDGSQSQKMKKLINTANFDIPVICVSNNTSDFHRARFRQKIERLYAGDYNGSHSAS